MSCHSPEQEEDSGMMVVVELVVVVLIVVMVVVVVVVLRSSTLEFLSPVTLQHCLTSVVAEEAAVAASVETAAMTGNIQM